MLVKHSSSPPVRPRAGTLVPLLAISMVVLVGFLALAIDLGMMAISKTQAQNAADVAVLTAARTLTGNSANNYNQAAATTNAKNILTYNKILNQPVQSSQLTLTYGSYDYNQTTQTFSTNFPASTGSATTAVSIIVTSAATGGFFSKAMGVNLIPSVSATAQAVHRPRDIAFALDLSSSMRLGTALGFDITNTYRGSNNPDSLIPTFSHYTSGTDANMQGLSTDQTSSFQSYTVSPSNTTVSNASYAKTYISNFMQNNAYASTLVRAFDSYTSSDGGTTWVAPSSSATPRLPSSTYATTPGGTVPLFKSGSTSTYAETVSDVVGSTTANILWELDGYSAYVNGTKDTSTGGYPSVWYQINYSAIQFSDYTQGPGYYGKTFFVWPPDPRNGAITGAANVKTWLLALGMPSADATTLSNNWATYQSQGISTGLTNMETWMITKGYAGGTYVPGSNNKALTLYAVCRLFNRGYPSGTSKGAFSADWRARFFGTTNNSKIFGTGLSPPGTLNVPSSTTYTINYNAILAWITETPNPFPAQLRSGRIKYYGSIPTAITGSFPSYGGTDQRFWVEEINAMLGLYQSASGVYTDVSCQVGYGGDFTWGTTAVTAAPSSVTQYMSYSDNPARPRLRYWFGPLEMVDYLQDYNLATNLPYNYTYLQPGDSYEAPIYTAKEAYLASIDTLSQNHPNDWFTLVPYSWPRSSYNGTFGRSNCVAAPLGTNYDYAASTLLYPYSTINADGSCNNTEVTPYDADPVSGVIPSSNFADIMRANGDTCFAMALMLCHNQFAVTPTGDATLRSYVSSSPITFPSGMAGGMGRKGAQKVVIFETDGIPNCYASASLVTNSTYSYYKIRYDMNKSSASEFPTVTASSITDTGVETQIYSLIQTLVSTYGTTRNPFRLYAVGFGPVFQGANAPTAIQTLQSMQYYAGTQTSASTALSSSQIVTGTDSEMSTNMESSFTSILQSGVQIGLVK